MRANMIFTDKEGILTLSPQSATKEQLLTIESLKKSNPAVDGNYGRYSDGRISVNTGNGGRIIINQNGEIKRTFLK